MDSRKRMGKDKGGVIFPVAPNLSEMSDSYLDFIEEVKKEIQKQRISVVLNANSSMICLYWNIGRAILQKQEEEGWGSKVIDRMAKDLKEAFSDMSGFSPRNIKYMRKFAECWPDFEIVQQVVAQIPWRTNRMLLDKLNTQEERLWYAHKTIENGWSSNVLELQIQNRLMERAGKSVNNFPVALPPVDSDMADQIFKDPYLFDFLGTDMPRREVEIERQLTEHIQNFLLELGQGFAFVGRQNMDSRKRMGKDKGGVIFPVAPNLSEMSDSYLDFIEEVKKEIQKQRISVVLNANSSMICLYWNIGRAILQKQEEEGWGSKVIDRMAKDLKEAFSDMSGFSPRNIKYMRKFAECWPDFEIVQQVVAQIPWRTNRMLLDKLNTQEERLWYAHKTIENGWSSNVLELQIQNRLMERAGKSVNNFPVALPPVDSDMADQIFKDPYLFDFLGTDMPRREVEIERQLTEHIQNFLLELGQGFAFVGRQVHLEVGGDDFYIDLLFYHLKLRCYVVIELKACDFEPGFISQLNMYQNVVNDILRHPDDKPTIGLLLVKGKNQTVVEYSLAGYQNPIGVAEWKNQMVQALPEELKSSLPSIEEIEKELE